MREMLFQVRTGSGHIYTVYTDGEIEGFGDGCMVLNCYPILASLVHASAANGISAAPEFATNIASPERRGAGHSIPA